MNRELINIRTFRRANARPEFPVYLLSHGNNAGKTSFTPIWENGFVIACKDEQERDQMHALCTALFYADRYKFYLIGSVIPFIRIGDARRVVEHGWHSIKNSPKAAAELVKIGQLVELRYNTQRQAETTEEMLLLTIKSACSKYI